MFWYVTLMLFSALYLMFGLVFRNEQTHLVLGGIINDYHRLAARHSGDSDSTGAITGNILGALWGRSAIPEEFLGTLELRAVIEELSLDLYGMGAGEDYRKYPPW